MKTGIHLALRLIIVSLAAAGIAFGQQGDQLGKVEFANSCSPAVQGQAPARGRDAAFVLLQRDEARVRGDRAGGSELRDRRVGLRLDPDEQPARRPGRLGQGRTARAGGDREGPAHGARKPSASATISRRSRRTTRTGRIAPRRSGSWRARRRTRRSRPSTRRTTRRRSSTRCTSRPRNRKLTRPLLSISRRRRSSSRSSPSTQTTLVWRTT